MARRERGGVQVSSLPRKFEVPKGMMAANRGVEGAPSVFLPTSQIQGGQHTQW